MNAYGTSWRGDMIRMVVILALGLLWLAMLDVAVLEWIYKPLIAAHKIKESELEAGPGILYWHVAFIPFGLALFAMFGLSAGDNRLAVAGIILFATGWEDMAYYLLLLQPLPSVLPWLNIVPTIAWTRFLTRTPDVTAAGLVAAALAGALLAVLLAYLITKKFRNCSRGA